MSIARKGVFLCLFCYAEWCCGWLVINSWMLKCLIILAWIFKFLQAYSDFRGIYQISLSFCYKPGGLGMLNCTPGDAS
jgi:hypothetical protein